MDRIAAATLIALATLGMTLVPARDVLAREAATPVPAAASAAAPAAGARVLGLLLTLEALRSAPALLDSRKV